MLKAKIACQNEGTASQYYFLVIVENDNPHDNFVHPTAPNNWKTAKGAQRWAERRGLEVIK